MSRSQRDKGAGYEREIANDLKLSWGRPVARELGQARDAGCDIKVLPFYIECKRRHSLAVYAWLDQAVVAASAVPYARYPVVIARADQRESVVIMRYADWKELAAGELEEPPGS